MFMWDQILALGSEETRHIFQYYAAPFSTEIRHAAAYWIEETFHASQQLDPNDPLDVPKIEAIILSLSNELESRASEDIIFNGVNIRELIRQTVTNIRFPLRGGAVNLFTQIRTCLNMEREYLQRRNSNTNQPPASPLAYHSQLIKPDSYTWTIVQRIQNCHQEIAQTIMQLQRPNDPTQPGTSNTPTPYMLQVKAVELKQTLEDLYTEFGQKFDAYCANLQIQLTAVHSKVLRLKEERLLTYRGIMGSEPTVQVNDLQIHSEYCANRLRCLIALLKKVWHFNANPPQYLMEGSTGWVQKIQNSQCLIAGNLKTLMAEAFIIRTQPSPLTRTETYTKPTIQLLVGEQAKPSPSSKIHVTLYLLNEIQMQELIQNQNASSTIQKPRNTCCKIENNSATFETDRESKAYLANFKNAQLPKKKDVKRLCGKKIPGIEKVTDEIFWFYYYAEWSMDNIQFRVGTFSYPLRVICNSSQEYEGSESILWDIAAGRLGFDSVSNKPTQVPFHDLASAVSAWFYRLTGRAIKAQEWRTIANKMLSPGYGMAVQTDPFTPFTLQQFKVDNAGACNKFTFWKWIYNNMKLIMEHLGKRGSMPSLWETEAILGCIDEEKSRELLLAQPEGTFLARFSYTTCGALTVDFLMNGRVQSTRFSAEDLKCRSLLNIISDIPVWRYLLSQDSSNIPKDELLRLYMPPVDASIPPLRIPYVKTGLIARLEATA